MSTDPARTVRAARPAVLANPVLIGAVTVLAVLVAVFLAYSANRGLPFVPTRELKVDVTDGAQLVVGNDVREGGFRIGFVSDLRPVRLPNGTIGAQLTLKLDPSKGAVPVDSSVTIRARSVLGLKYVDLERGTSAAVIADGGTLYSPRAVPVQFDELFDTFDPPTRHAIKRDLTGFGDALAGRGGALNATIATLPELFRHLTPVARYLSQPATGLSRFLRSLNTFMRTLAPVAGTGARLFTGMATTFAALARDPGALQATIAQSPSTLDVATDSLAAQRPFLADLTALGRSLAPAAAELRPALPDINPAIEAGAQTLSLTPPLDVRLQAVMGSLKTLATAPGTNPAVGALADTTATLNPMVRYLGPYVTVCNDWNYWWTYLAEHLSERTSFGFAQRALLNLANLTQPNNVGVLGATAPANGGGFDSLLGGNEFLQSQGYGAAVDTHGNADCETGQRGYPQKLNAFDPRGRNLVTDVHTPGDQGPTFTGRPRVPAGETFTREPQTGPPLPSTPGNP